MEYPLEKKPNLENLRKRYAPTVASCMATSRDWFPTDESLSSSDIESEEAMEPLLPREPSQIYGESSTTTPSYTIPRKYIYKATLPTNDKIVWTTLESSTNSEESNQYVYVRTPCYEIESRYPTGCERRRHPEDHSTVHHQ